MEVKAIIYKHEPGVALFLVPDTDVERALLRSLWAHGRLDICNGVADDSGEGFQIVSHEKGQDK